MSDTRNSLFRLKDFGVSVWCDELSRDIIRGGRLKQLIAEKAVVGVTSNPSIFQKALSEGTAYDADIAALAARGKTTEEIFDALAIDDIREACDVLRPVYDSTGGEDGYVSIEVSPSLADDTEKTVSEAIRYHREIARPNLMVKIPATRAGLPAIQRMIALGKSINITLIFSVDRYAAVAEAYLAGLEELAKNGGDLRPVASVASFFVSRIDTEADKRIDEALARETDPDRKERLEHLKGKIAIANAKLAFARFKEIFSGPRWEALAIKGARAQRCLWASTSTKNKNYPDILYVQELISGPAVNTLPIKTMEAYLDHGIPEETLSHGVDEARHQIETLAEFGIDYHDITDNFAERDGVQKFVDSYVQLLAGLDEKVRHKAAS
ncbi:MAG TPA: transaldolase [Candidatus Limnocylindrales bacterium]|nr:transaldolase [Candidatus Limnocylindrales bacterium]